jgi:hypothetical protein
MAIYLNMAIYLIEGSPATYEDAEDYFITYSGFSHDDARHIFRTEDAEFISDNCPEIEILTKVIEGV